MSTASARALVASALHRIAPEVDLETVHEDGALHDEAGLDSLDFLTLATAIGDAVGREVPERDYPELATFAGCVAYVARSL